jgi:hypothetical protein
MDLGYAVYGGDDDRGNAISRVGGSRGITPYDRGIDHIVVHGFSAELYQ